MYACMQVGMHARMYVGREVGRYAGIHASMLVCMYSVRKEGRKETYTIHLNYFTIAYIIKDRGYTFTIHALFRTGGGTLSQYTHCFVQVGVHFHYTRIVSYRWGYTFTIHALFRTGGGTLSPYTHCFVQVGVHFHYTRIVSYRWGYTFTIHALFL